MATRRSAMGTKTEEVNRGGGRQKLDANTTEGGKLAPSSKGGESGKTVAVYSGVMDTPRTALNISMPTDLVGSDLSPETLMNNSSLRMSDSEAAGKLQVIGQVCNYLDVEIGKQRIAQKAITLKTEQVNTSTAAYNYSTAVSKNENAQDKAEHENYMTKLKKQIRAHDRTGITAQERIAKNRAGAKVARAGKIQEVDGGDSVMDAEFVA